MFTEEEKKILEQYVTSTEENVFAVKNLQGLTGAAYARYSRAKGGFREVLLKEFIQEGAVDPKHADELIARVLVAYGDDSVGELEGAHLSFERISMLATKEIEDHRIGGSPIEQSTRYVLYDQKDDSGGWLYYKGKELTEDPGFGKLYVETMEYIFQTYSDLVEPMKNYFMNLKKLEDAEYDINGDSVKEKWADLKDEKEQKAFKQTYNFDLRAKACDTLRALLPLSTFTNVGIFGNGRFFQTVISHLLTQQEIPEFKAIGNMAFNAASEVIPQYVRRAKPSEYVAQENHAMYALAKEMFDQNQPEKPSELPSFILVDKGEEYIASKIGVNPDPKKVAELVNEAEDLLEIAAMLYPYTNVSWTVLRNKIGDMSESQRKKIVEAYVQDRQTRRDRPGRALETGYPYNFDLVTNWGVYKDLMRHRMNTQQRQLFSTKLGFYMPEEISIAGFEDRILECVKRSDALYDAIFKKNPRLAQYAVLHGHYVRWSISLNDRGAMHLLELRSTPQGHPNYRQAAQQMHKLIAQRSKWRADMMKFVDYNDYYWSRADSEAKQRVKERELDKKYGKPE